MAVVTVTPTSSSSGDASSTLSSGAVAGIVIGTILGLLLLAALVFYLLRRYRQHRFTRVPNHPRDDVSTPAGALDLPSTSPRKANSTRHSQRPSRSSEPLISPSSWPPIPPTSRVHSPATPPRSGSVSPNVRESHFSIGEVTRVIAAGPVTRSAAPAILSIPPLRKPEQKLSPTRPQPSLFLNRMVQSRARASEGVAPARDPSLDSAQSRSTTRDSSAIPADLERLLAEAERTALQDMETAQRDGEGGVPEEDDLEEAASTESEYSQLSAPLDCSASFLDPASFPNGTLSGHRRRPSRRQSRATELAPVAEVPDTPRVLEGRCDASSIAVNSSLDGQVSHRTVSPPMSTLDPSVSFPLLTSANFGKDSTSSGTAAGSISSTAGWGSGSSGRASRYPSLAQSSIAQCSHSGSRSDGGTDWRHPPSGLSGLKTLQIGPLWNPHSPVEEHPEHPDASLAAGPTEPAPVKRAHLREGTTSSVPELERRTVTEGGIARIDVAF